MSLHHSHNYLLKVQGHYRQNHRHLGRTIALTSMVIHRVYLVLNPHQYQVKAVVIQGHYWQNHTKPLQGCRLIQLESEPLPLLQQTVSHTDVIDRLRLKSWSKPNVRVGSLK